MREAVETKQKLDNDFNELQREYRNTKSELAGAKKACD